MPDTIITKDLLEKSVTGCQTPPEQCKDNGTTFLRTRCHTDKPYLAAVVKGEIGDAVALCCIAKDCRGGLALSGTFTPSSERALTAEIVTPPCHPTAPVWASYTKGTGVVEVICYHCRKKVGEVKLD